MRFTGVRSAVCGVVLDDTSVGGPRKSFYADFATLRRNAFHDCDLLSTLPKIRVFNPLGGVQGIPAWILEAQGGEIFGFELVGAFVGAATPSGVKYRRDALADTMKERLAFLDRVDVLGDPSTHRDALQIRYHLLRRNASRMPIYWARTMPPFITTPVMRTVVEPRLRASLELLADTSASTADQVERWWQLAALPTNMGGEDVGGNDIRCCASERAACSGAAY